MISFKNLFIFFLLLCSISSCSQVNYGIKKATAYTQTSQRGTLQVDDNGNPINEGPIIHHTIYVETTNASKINWEHAWLNGKTYNITSSLLTNFPVEVGVNKVTKERILLNPSIGNKLWKLELLPSNKKVSPPPNKSKGIILQGWRNNKKIVQPIDQLIELFVPDAV